MKKTSDMALGHKRDVLTLFCVTACIQPTGFGGFAVVLRQWRPDGFNEWRVAVYMQRKTAMIHVNELRAALKRRSP